MIQIGRRNGFYGKPLHKDSIDAVLLHPAEVAQHSFLRMRAKQVSHRAVGMAKRRVIFLVVVQLTNVGPEINGAMTGSNLITGTVMRPAALRAIAGRGEPALVAAHDFAMQGRT